MTREARGGDPWESEESATHRKDLIVGIPAYNEEIGIGSVILGSKRFADEIVVVDDGSSDRTADIAQQAGVTVLEHETNQGKGAALQTLFSYIRSSDVDPDAVVCIDGDGQHVPADIPRVVEPVVAGDCDIAIGSRYVNRERTETPLYRRFGQRVLDVLTTGSSGTHLTDTQSGFRVMSPAALSRLQIRTDGMGVESEMVGNAVDGDLTIGEVPISVRYDGIDGQTYNPLRHGLSVAVYLTQLIRDRHPLLFFGVPGVVFLGVGGLLAIQSVLLYQNGAFHQWRVLSSGLLTIIGILALFCGLILSQFKNMILELSR